MLTNACVHVYAILHVCMYIMLITPNSVREHQLFKHMHSYLNFFTSDSEWDLDNPLVVKVHSGDDPIMCMCQVQQKLWIGAGNLCYVLNMLSCQMEVNMHVCVGE